MYGFESFAEVPYATLNSLVGAVEEAIALAAAQNVSLTIAVQTDESISFSASEQAATAFGEVYVVESIGLYDDNNVAATFARMVTESMGLTAAQNTTVAFVGATEEEITLTAVETGYFAFYANVNESMSISAAQNVLAVFAGSVAESFALTESQSARADFVGTVTEQLNLTAQPCAFGWFSINDDQQPVWGYISQTVSEVAAYGAFTFGGVPFAGSYSKSGLYPAPLPDEQAPGWSAIDDDVPTTWSEIDNSQNC